MDPKLFVRSLGELVCDISLDEVQNNPNLALLNDLLNAIIIYCSELDDDPLPF